MEKVTKKQHGLLEMLRNRLNPAIEDLGYELYDLEDLQYQDRRILRVSIDHEQGIQLEDCVRINQKLQKLLDENDPIEEAYTLEVSSPGIFRVLKNPEHFRRFSGERIKIRLKKKINGMRHAIGKLCSSTEDGIQFLPENEIEEGLFIYYENINKARLEPELN
ncbi:MAG: ribosome maturation factor RimP [bacterium]